MSFRVSGKNLEIGAALQDHARARIATIIGKYFDTEPAGHVTLEPEGSGFRADMFVHLANGVTVQTEGRAHDPYASFDQAADRVETRLRRHKRRFKDRHGAGGTQHSDGAPVAIVANYIIEAPDAEEIAPDFSPIVVAESKSRLRDLSVSAAVLELDMSGAPLLVFRHSTTEEVNVVYRRADGHIGWIDPAGTADRPAKRA
ncbi:MAG TPA: ribosome-associated translation inhibitor RaiA [Lichenihabitans sp.]|jgi:ribosomal subunit interface protein|nr:ribosome-associated translation inhibitor RaiA [Lichenihabitans sp.]